MIDLDDPATEIPFDDRSWLLVGKGPTFDRLYEVDLGSWNICGLNHAAALIGGVCHLAHAIDVEVLEGATFSEHSWLAVPKLLHRGCTASGGPGVVSLIAPDGLLHGRERLIVYSKVTGFIGDHPGRVCAWYFSAEAALCILGLFGARTVRTVGIDGGTGYSEAFDKRDRLCNGRSSFDGQTKHLLAIADHYGIDYGPYFKGAA